MPTQADLMLIDLFEVVYLSRHNEKHRWYVKRKGSNELVENSFATQQEAEHALETNVRTRISQLHNNKQTTPDENFIKVRHMYINHK